MRSDVAAAVAAGAAFGIFSNAPLVVHETNNTVVWLRPEAVVAKVATRPDARDDVRLEHEIALELVAVGGEIASPMPGTGVTVHEETGFVVTLWERLDGAVRSEVEPAALHESLLRLHGALARTTHELPTYRASLTRARAALDDQSVTAAMLRDDAAFLRDVYDDGLSALGTMPARELRLHGEPHDGNRMMTAAGLRWVDFESCCIGPPEWHLGFLPAEFDRQLVGIDHDLLALLRRLNSARVATWCLGQTRHREMRRYGEVHVAVLRGHPDH